MPSPREYDVLKNSKRKRAQKSKEQTTITTKTFDVLKDEKEYSSSNRQDTNIKGRKKASKEKTPVDIDAINRKRKSTRDGIDQKMIYNNKNNSSLDKRKAKARTSKKDAFFPTTTNSKGLEDEDDTLLLNTQVKKKMKKDISKDPVTTMTVKEITVRDDRKEYSDNVFNATVHTNESQICKFNKCDVCKKSFRYRFALNKHKTNCHVPYVARFVCNICSKPFENSSDYLEHICINKMKCQICNITCSTKTVLHNHYKKQHVDVDPYACDVCSRSFNLVSTLTIHYRQHTGEKPYVCDVCGKTFWLKGSLTIHYRRHTGEQPYMCGICGRTFEAKYVLTCHCKRHIGERPYMCDICEKTFSNRSSLIRHLYPYRLP